MAVCLDMGIKLLLDTDVLYLCNYLADTNMKLLKQSGPFCLLYAASMVLDAEPQVLISEIGHDGKEILFPTLFGDDRYRNFNMQEIIDCGFRRRVAFTPIYAEITQGLKGLQVTTLPRKEGLDKITRHILNSRQGIIIGKDETVTGHAVAYFEKIIYDPKGRKEVFADFMVKFTIDHIWIANRF